MKDANQHRLRLDHVLFDAPKLASGGGVWLHHPLACLEIADGMAWVAGAGIILRVDLSAGDARNISWAFNDETLDIGSSVDDIKPIVYEFEPRLLKAFSANACRVVGCSDGEIAMWETQDAGTLWNRVRVGPCEDADDIYAGAMLPSNEIRLVLVRDGVATVNSITPFGELSELFQWDFSCIRGSGNKLFFLDDLCGFVTLGTQDRDHHRAYSKLYETLDSGMSWRCLGEFSLDSVLGLGPDGAPWIGSGRGFLYRRVRDGWVGDQINPAFEISSMALCGPGPPLLLNDRGVGYALREDRWFLVEADEELSDYWLQMAWLTEKRLLLLSADRLCIAELGME